MDAREHVRTTATALKHWFTAMAYDALAIGILWFVGLLIICVPWAPLWALLGGTFQFIPNIGPVLALIGPSLAILFSSGSNERFLYLLILYAIIAVTDGLVLQPYFMKRTARVPIWASILAPIVLGIVIPFWGVLLAPPLLAIVYAYRRKGRAALQPSAPSGGEANDRSA